MELLTDDYMLLLVRKGIRDGIYHTINNYAKAKNKCMKDYGPKKELSDLMYWDLSNLYGLAMSQKLSLDGFEWQKDTLFSKRNENWKKKFFFCNFHSYRQVTMELIVFHSSKNVLLELISLQLCLFLCAA